MELLLFTLTALARIVAAQYPPPPLYDRILKSPVDPAVTISYRVPDAGTCTTAFSTQKQYSGYITIPPYTLAPVQQNYSINTFFWFIEARQTPETAPLTIWLNGGPGTSSMFGLFQENGPCEVVQMSDGTYGTQARMWGWDRSSNVLYIDQPNQVGFSFDTRANATYDFYNGLVFDYGAMPNASSDLLRPGTFSSSNGYVSYNDTQFTAAPNTTQIAARATWHFLQSWLAAFPQYNPVTRPNVTTVNEVSAAVGVHLFSESYGGHYGPAFAAYFEQQNALRASGALSSNTSLAIELKTLGIVNGLVDKLTQDITYAYFPYNNTYGIEAIDQTTELNELTGFTAPGGCADAIGQCRTALEATDPDGDGDSGSTNELCLGAQLNCARLVDVYTSQGYDPYDIRRKYPNPDPPMAYAEYLNYPSVLAAVGAGVNYTEASKYVQYAFISTGDAMRDGQAQALADLLSSGVRVALIYGDADFLCNWYGGEAVSLQVAGLVPTSPTAASGLLGSSTSYASAFPAAGYADIVVNSSYVGGAVRQYGNLSFSRIYNAGHFVPYYQPETAFTVFTRIIEGTDVSTGEIVDLASYGSSGPKNASYTQSASGATPSPTCWLRDINGTCSSSEIQDILLGGGRFQNGIFLEPDESISLPRTTVTAGVPGSPPTSGRLLSDTASSYTGVYTATGTPSQRGAAPGLVNRDQHIVIWPLVSVIASFILGGATVLV